MMRRFLRLLVALPLLAVAGSACSKFGPFGRCPEGATITGAELMRAGVRKLVLQSQSPVFPEWVRYRSLADFVERNPDCCFITKPEAFVGGQIDLPIGTWADMPFGGTMEYSIRYRRLERGPTPFSIRRVAVGPCPTDMEEAEQPLTPGQYEASSSRS